MKIRVLGLLSLVLCLSTACKDGKDSSSPPPPECQIPDPNCTPADPLNFKADKTNFSLKQQEVVEVSLTWEALSFDSCRITRKTPLENFNDLASSGSLKIEISQSTQLDLVCTAGDKQEQSSLQILVTTIDEEPEPDYPTCGERELFEGTTDTGEAICSVVNNVSSLMVSSPKNKLQLSESGLKISEEIVDCGFYPGWGSRCFDSAFKFSNFFGFSTKDGLHVTYQISRGEQLEEIVVGVVFLDKRTVNGTVFLSDPSHIFIAEDLKSTKAGYLAEQFESSREAFGPLLPAIETEELKDRLDNYASFRVFSHAARKLIVGSDLHDEFVAQKTIEHKTNLSEIASDTYGYYWLKLLEEELVDSFPVEELNFFAEQWINRETDRLKALASIVLADSDYERSVVLEGLRIAISLREDSLIYRAIPHLVKHISLQDQEDVRLIIYHLNDSTPSERQIAYDGLIALSPEGDLAGFEPELQAAIFGSGTTETLKLLATTKTQDSTKILIESGLSRSNLENRQIAYQALTERNLQGFENDLAAIIGSIGTADALKLLASIDTSNSTQILIDRGLARSRKEDRTIAYDALKK